ncbi:AAA family ATPase [Microvirga aerilata]|uniref:AAA family ATPase n=1 Tax=Microvirga aerilata TaxID=670292 RepID=A0A937CY66_9HYPH|nr:AAA family ATPase [Microvirga aerilata]MBL0406543.1 AAA family ATPase [Microvirga aerilata]
MRMKDVNQHERDRSLSCTSLADGTIARESVKIPRIVIHAFCDSADAAAAIEQAAADRLMTRTHVAVQLGGIVTATELYQNTPTPDVVIVQSHLDPQAYLAGIDRLAEVCYTGTKVMAIGEVNDISFYRELMRRGVSEYILGPIEPVLLISSVARMYGEAYSGKFGQVHAFIGAKGGVGSSTLSHNVGWTIARELGSNVIMADLDLPFGTAGLDFNLDANQGVADAIQATSRLDEVLLDRLLQKCGEHLSLLSAPAALEATYDVNEEAVEQLIEVAQKSAPFLILDMPHLWTKWAKKTVVAATDIVITAAPDLANLRNTKSLIHVLRHARPHDPPPKLVLNQIGMTKRPEIKVNDFIKAVDIQPTACIPFDAHLFGTASNKGQVVAEASTKGPAINAFREIADAITGRQGMKRRNTARFGLRNLLGRAGRKPT